MDESSTPPPAKRRRFFTPDPSEILSNHSPNLPGKLAPPANLDSKTSSPLRNDVLATQQSDEPDLAPRPTSAETKFDRELFEGIVGEKIDNGTLEEIIKVSEGNLERAVNVFFDGSYSKKQLSPLKQTPLPTHYRQESSELSEPLGNKKESETPEKDVAQDPVPAARYVGAFGVEGWATRSSSSSLNSGEKVIIEREQPRNASNTHKAKGMIAFQNRVDIIVRFTNTNGQEVGRLPRETAEWVSMLIDQGICRFEAVCIYCPEKVRINDSVYLQLKAYLLRDAFTTASFAPLESNRATGLFEAKETKDERVMRLRQVGLVKLFEHINLQPVAGNASSEQQKRQNLLAAAETAEQQDLAKAKEGKGSSTPPDEEAEEGKVVEQDQLDALYKKAQSFDFSSPEADPAKSFVLNLRPYQKQALHWMLAKERKEDGSGGESMHPLWEEYIWPTKDMDDQPLPSYKGQNSFYVNPYSGDFSLDFPRQEQNCLGGVLADEMGLGKTIEMLSLIHSNGLNLEIPTKGPSRQTATVNDLTRMKAKSKNIEPAPQTTLVVAPMSLLRQWQTEAEKSSAPGTLRTQVYYGTEKALDLRTLCSNPDTSPHVLITSYGVVLSEYNAVASNGGNLANHTGIFGVEFLRIILDEAHTIKNRQAKTAKACYELAAKHRWVLTGTPIVNRLEDLFSLVRFLRVDPWGNFSYWKTFITLPFESGNFIKALDVVQTVLEPLVLRRTKDMRTPDGQPLVPLPPKNVIIENIRLSDAERDVYEYIFQRAKRTFTHAAEAGTVMKSYSMILAQILRLRQSCCHPNLVRQALVVNDEEAADAAEAFSGGLADDNDLTDLIERFDSLDGQEVEVRNFGADVLKEIQQGAKEECPICLDTMTAQTLTGGCWHSACKNCLTDYVRRQQDKQEIPRCFNCRKEIFSRELFEVVSRVAPLSASTSSSSLASPSPSSETPNGQPEMKISLRRLGTHGSAKIGALLTHLNTLRQQDPTVKSVVFSQFTSFLDIIQKALIKDSIPFVRFDGSMSQKQRIAVLTEFQESKEGLVLLLSLRAGGVGLNLTHAKRVYMMDPWWSFAVEAQAIDRVHRMGQEDPVTIIRFVVEESVEVRMLRIQDRKKFIASSLGMMSDEEKKLQRIEDIRELLS